MENYVIYVDNIGFFESMGHNGITYTKEINKAFQMRLSNARDIMRTLGKIVMIVVFSRFVFDTVRNF